MFKMISAERLSTYILAIPIARFFANNVLKWNVIDFTNLM